MQHLRSLTLGMKIMGSLLLLDLLLVGVGGFNLITLTQLHDRVTAVSDRDLEPLTHLRTAQNALNTIAIYGFAAGAATDRRIKDKLAEATVPVQSAEDEALTALRRTAPAEMRPQIDDLIATHAAFVTADRAYKADPTGPKAHEREATAQALFEQTGKKCDALAETFHQDARAQRAAVTAAYRRSLTVTVGLLTVGLTAGLALALGISRSVRRRTAVVVEGLDRLAQGDLTVSVAVGGDDEIARMARAINAGISAFRAAITEVRASATTLADSAHGLSGTTERTATAVDHASRVVQDVVLSAEAVTRTVDGVANSTVELAASIRDISDSAQQAARVAGDAVDVVETTNATISQLGNSSLEIGNVIQVIQNIAAQTSLLALNATIEAARAGEAGRGFAVVAGEVKDLARETAEATDSVISRVQAIQADTEGAVEAIARIGGIIQQINGFQSTIAAAVEEQSLTTDSISASLSEALGVTRQITSTVEEVSSATRGGREALGSTRSLADDVAGQGSQLSQVVSNFRI